MNSPPKSVQLSGKYTSFNEGIEKNARFESPVSCVTITVDKFFGTK